MNVQECAAHSLGVQAFPSRKVSLCSSNVALQLCNLNLHYILGLQISCKECTCTSHGVNLHFWIFNVPSHKVNVHVAPEELLVEKN